MRSPWDIRHCDLSKFDVIVVDETQRIYPTQLEQIVNEINSRNGSCIFSYDKRQTLSISESVRDIDSKINGIGGNVNFNLSGKIRTNKEIASFIKQFFNNKRNDKVVNEGNIDFDYFTNFDDAKDYINSINNSEWEIIRFTPSQYSNEHHETYSNTSCNTSHKIIGQEFDNVAVVIDRFFSYHQNGDLIYNGRTYYDAVKMLFQNITRTRKRLKLIIIGNNELLNRCLSILKY
jgi:hypothetical protein